MLNLKLIILYVLYSFSVFGLSTGDFNTSKYVIGRWKKLIVIGDSNTQLGYNENGKWICFLSDMLQRRCDVVNRGFSGYNTRYVKVIFDKIMKEFIAEDIIGVIILMGTNDSAYSPLQYISVDEYGENIKWIIDYLIKFGVSKEKLILITPAQIEDNVLAEYLGAQNYTSSHFDGSVKKYAQKCTEIAVKEGIKLVDLYNLMQRRSNGNLADFLYDGLHLSADGARFFFSYLWPVVEHHIVVKGKLETIYPNWDELEVFNDFFIEP
jgi:lysophospholipase L1-like esterase